MTNNINALPARGLPMPKTLEQFERIAELYESALLKEKEVNRRLREKLNKCEQKIDKAKQEQREKDAKIAEEFGLGIEQIVGEEIAKAIREE